ncbi:MAG: hypothetical protein ACREJN_10045, partial [Nitrospiraceae bacterium]
FWRYLTGRAVEISKPANMSLVVLFTIHSCFYAIYQLKGWTTDQGQSRIEKGFSVKAPTEPIGTSIWLE